MYKKTITIFNYYESATVGEAYWFPHVLNGVDLNMDRAAILKKYGDSTNDNAQLHVRLHEVAGIDGLYVNTTDGLIPWFEPKKWSAQTNDMLGASITFSTESDFFIEGSWDGGTVADADYRDGFYQHMNKSLDGVYKITSVGGPYSLIKHLEILAR